LLAIQRAANIDHELFKHLKKFTTADADSESQINNELIQCLSKAVAKNEQLALIFASLATSFHATALSILIISQTLKREKISQPTIPNVLFTVVRSLYSERMLTKELKEDLLSSYAEDAENTHYKELLDALINGRIKKAAHKLVLYAIANIVKFTPKLAIDDEYKEFIQNIYSLLISIKSPVALIHLSTSLQHLMQVHLASSSKDILDFLVQFLYDSKDALSSILRKSRSISLMSGTLFFTICFI
jgi:Rad3-related DNA helicase